MNFDEPFTVAVAWSIDIGTIQNRFPQLDSYFICL